MNKMIDMTGLRFGKVQVISFNRKAKSETYWNCVCDCGKNYVQRGSTLRRKTSPTRSCGCLGVAAVKAANTIHGMTKTRAYKAWIGMKSRCLYEKDVAYEHYKKRGITVCEDWASSFEQFYEDMGEPAKGLTLDRIDNNKGYFKENCRWADYFTQNRNRSDTKFFTYQGESKCIKEWALILGIKPHTVYKRVENGWDVETALTTPARRYG